MWTNLSLSARILIGLGLGIFAGLFFGEPAAVLQPAADIYIRLMQMTVLPYLVTSLVVAFGSLEVAEAKRMAVRGGIILVVVWAVTILVLVCIPLTFPEFDSAAFFSQSLVEPRQAFSLTDIYFTSNPFNSLAQNVVPAVVLFSCLMGVGLIGLKDKEGLIAPLRTWNQAIVRITHFVIELTPYGVFAIGAVTAGTMEPETLWRLEVYFIAFAAAAMLLGFWILPLIVTAVTPFSYREVAGMARDALLTAFVANSAFIVLPILVSRSKVLLKKHHLLNNETGSAADVLIPVFFNFPNAGKLLTLMFVPFAGWLSGAALAAADYPSLFAAGIPSYFAKAQIALPFLLDLFGLPQDLFQLYIPTTIITGKFDSLVTAMNLLVFALLGAGAMGGFLVFEKARLVRAAIGLFAGTAVVTVLLKFGLALAIDTDYRLDDALRQMHQANRASDTIVHRSLLPPAPDTGESVLERARARGSLRIGYDPDNLPMSFFNTDDELVGFDVALAERLAAALDLRAEFVPIDWSELPQLLEQGIVDVMPGMWYQPYWFSRIWLSEPYFTATVGLAVRDERRHDFDSLDELRASHDLKIGVPLDSSQLLYVMQHYFNGSNTEFVTVEFWNEFFEGRHPELDAFLMPVEHATGWSLLYPEYTVVVPQPNPVRVPVAFGVAVGADDLSRVVNEWILSATHSGIVEDRFEFWVMGQGAKDARPRWSIIRDVLGWVD